MVKKKSFGWYVGVVFLSTFVSSVPYLLMLTTFFFRLSTDPNLPYHSIVNAIGIVELYSLFYLPYVLSAGAFVALAWGCKTKDFMLLLITTQIIVGLMQGVFNIFSLEFFLINFVLIISILSFLKISPHSMLSKKYARK